MSIQLPYNFNPRDYQLPLLNSLDSGCKRAVIVWHRRSGKDKTLVNFVGKKTHERIGAYHYYFPTSVMGRKILWDGMDKSGFKFMNHFPKELIAKKNEQEMKIQFKNGSQFQIIGTDKLELVGTNPIGCVFSEYSLQNPKAWEYVRPILAENGGWAIFNMTPRGHNHGYTIYKMASANPAWFCQLLTVKDTKAISLEAIQEDRNSGMSDAMVEQEYYCSFELGVEGAYYSKEMSKAVKEGRLTLVPIDDTVPVWTFWDLGISDSMSIWFAQFVGREIHLVDYYEANNYGFKHYAEMLKNKGYFYGGHFAPHDINAREMSVVDENGRAMRRIDSAAALGIKFERVPNSVRLEDGIEQVRGLLGQCWFDSKKCEFATNCLENYHKSYDEKRKIFSDKPEHDWSSHCADAFRTLAVAYRAGMIKYVESRSSNNYRQARAETSLD